MAFNNQCLGTIGSAANLATNVLQDGSITGAPQVFTYISVDDTAAQIAAADYFVQLAPTVHVGDFIHAIGSDTGVTLTVAAVTVFPNPTVITVQSVSTGNVDGPPSSTDRSIVTWNGSGGNLLRNNPGAGIDSSGNLGATSLTSGTVPLPFDESLAHENDAMVWDDVGEAVVFRSLRVFTGLTVLGQLLMGKSTGNPEPVTLLAGNAMTIDIVPDITGNTITFSSATLANGTGITITYDAPSNTYTINSSGGGLSTIEVTGTSATMVINTEYVANNVGLVTLTLPAAAAFGSLIRVSGKGSGGWRIQCNGGQVIHVGSDTTTSGGTVSSSGQWDVVEIKCLTANTVFSASGIQSLGLTVA